MIRPLPTTILPRLGQLVRVLGSPVDGEALAACRALLRTLQGAGLDVHDLAHAVEYPALTAAKSKRPASKPRKAARPRPAEPSPRPAPPPRPPREPQRTDLVRIDEEQRAEILEGLAEAVEDADGRLSDWSRKFAADLSDQLGRRRLFPTERQYKFIVSILTTLREPGR